MRSLLIVLLLLPLALLAGDMKAVKAGDTAPSFALKNHDGKEHSLDKILKENKFAVVMFISTECPVSNAYNERMVKLYDSYGSKGVAFVGVNANKAESVKDIESHSKDKGFKFVVLKDEKNKIADAYGAQVTPEVYLINKDGKILYHGRIDDNRNSSKVETSDLSAAIDAALAGKEIAKSEAKAFGCSIKRVDVY